MMEKMNTPADWQLFYFSLFKVALDELEQTVTKLALQDPLGYKAHLKTRLLASVYKAVTQVVPADPDHPDFRLGKTLGAQYSHW
jgi:toxin YhaV